MLPVQSSVSEYIDLMLGIKWSSFLTHFTRTSSTTRVKLIALVSWHQSPSVLTHSWYPNGANFLDLQEFLLVIVPTPRVSFWYTPIRRLPTLSSCIAQQSTLGTKIGASSCIRSICVLPWDKNNYVKTHVSCFLRTYHTVPMHLGRIQVGHLHRCISLEGDWIAASRDADLVRILLLGAKVHDGICVGENFPAASACTISSHVITNIKFVLFWPFVLSPCAIPPKSFPSALCQTSAVAGLFINFCN